MDLEQIVMELVVHGGDARSKALEAVASAGEGNFEEAKEKMNACEAALNKAHNVQTQLIQDEINGNKTEITLLVIHAQDHLMNAMTVRDLAVKMIEMYQKINK